MRGSRRAPVLVTTLMAVLVAFATPALTQEKSADTALVPYTQAEIFFDTRYDGVSRECYQAGAEIELTSHWRVESYYRRHEDRQPSRRHENGIGLVLQYYY
jgi:hypothetical protein